MRVTHEDYVELQADIGNFETDAKTAKGLFKALTSGMLSVEESDLLTSTGTLLADLEKAHFDRAVLLADLIRQTGGALEVDIDHWAQPIAEMPAQPTP
jgi:hypothetical protein